MKKLELPIELKKYEKEIMDSVIPYAEIVSNEEKSELWDSKLGGEPYFPKDMEYPVDCHKDSMKLLIQINFEQLPKMENFPTEGILQLFLCTDDELYGVGEGLDPDGYGFRAIYHKNIIKDRESLLKDFSFVESKIFPLTGESKISYKLSEEPFSFTGNSFTKVFGPWHEFEDFDKFRNYWDNNEITYEYNKIAGYGYFLQGDPTEKDQINKDKILLAQLSSCDIANMRFGDCGIAYFLIDKNDLINLDFSKIYYAYQDL